MQTAENISVLDKENLLARVQELERKNAALQQQVDWFHRQYFGQKSERRLFADSSPNQLWLGDVSVEATPPAESETVRSYQRKSKSEKSLSEDDTSTGLRFDERVPVETILVPDPRLDGLTEGKDYEVIAEKETHRLAQRPGSYVVLKYVRKVVKLSGAEAPSCPPAPSSVLERSYADVSFLAGLLVDKFVYHLPLYRQHQRLSACGITLSRQTLTNLVFRAVELLEPVYFAQFSSVLTSKVLAMDETPIRAGPGAKGKLHQGYFWPVYGDHDEVVFPYSRTRAHATVKAILGEFCGTLLTDGYEAYERYAGKRNSVVHAQCWAHTRRKFEEAKAHEPELCAEALEQIGKIYAAEEFIRQKSLVREDKLEYRAETSKPLVEGFFQWLNREVSTRLLLPSSPFLGAASYALEREKELSVFLQDSEVAVDTNHLERSLRPIPMGRKNWLFCWTELGAEVVGKIQSLLVTCKLHEVDPYVYLVDVLQRIDSHPALDVHLLTPRLWKENFGSAPIPSDVMQMTPS